MLVLGLCVAHDAGVALIDDGRVVGLVQRERMDRLKRSALITPDFLEHALRQLGVEWAQIDIVAISTCQSWPFLFTEPERFRFAYDPDVAETLGIRGSLASAMRGAGAAFERNAKRTAIRVGQISEGLYGEYMPVDPSPLKQEGRYSICVEWPISARHWIKRLDSDVGTREQVATGLDLKPTRIGYVPARVEFDGVEKPGVLVPHHLAHAAYGFYQSGEDRASIATLDNGDVMAGHNGYVGGILAVGEGTRISVLDFRFAFEGHLYQRIGETCRLGHGGAAGKLMGLAPYGEPAYFHPAMVGDARQIFGKEYLYGIKQGRGHVMSPVMGLAKAA